MIMERLFELVLSAVPKVSLQFSALVLVLVSWRMSRWITRWEGWKNRVDVKLGISEPNGNGEKFSRVITRGDLLEFDMKREKIMREDFMTVQRCRLMHKGDGPS